MRKFFLQRNLKKNNLDWFLVITFLVKLIIPEPNYLFRVSFWNKLSDWKSNDIPFPIPICFIPFLAEKKVIDGKDHKSTSIPHTFSYLQFSVVTGIQYRYCVHTTMNMRGLYQQEARVAIHPPDICETWTKNVKLYEKHCPGSIFSP